MRPYVSLLAMVACCVPAYAQAGWVVVPGAGTSLGRRTPARAASFDTARDRIVVFDGSIPGMGTPAGETWEFDGVRWYIVSNPVVPRGGGVLVYDPGRLVHVYFEPPDRSVAGFPQGLWEWDGQTWNRRNPSMVPSSRYGASMAYDAVNGGVLLFGGSTLYAFKPNPVDTWLWDGTQWRQMSPSRHPPPTEFAGMVTDTNRNRIIMYGESPTSAGVWSWDGAEWEAVHVARFPTPGRDKFGLIFDACRDRVVLVGGSGYVGAQTVNFRETWEFDGVTWSLRPVGVTPPCMGGAGVVYDPLAERMLLVGGIDWSDPRNPCYNLDVWELRTPSPASYHLTGSGCAGSLGVPTLSPAAGGRPWLGDMLSVDLLNVPRGTPAFMATGFSTASWGNLRLPWDLALLGAPGCLLQAEPVVWNTFVPDQTVSPRWSLVIPGDPSLAGRSFHNQALVLDPQANALGATLSNLSTGTIGIR